MSDDYAIPPDALSQSESTCMDASMPSLLMRASYADSPNKKMESLEKVCKYLYTFIMLINIVILVGIIFILFFLSSDWTFSKIGW